MDGGAWLPILHGGHKESGTTEWLTQTHSISNSQKRIEWIYREVEGYGKPGKHCESIQHN